MTAAVKRQVTRANGGSQKPGDLERAEAVTFYLIINAYFRDKSREMEKNERISDETN